MKKRVLNQKFNGKKSHSDLLKRGMLLSLLTYGKIETISAKAKILKAHVDDVLSYSVKLDKTLVYRMIKSRYGSAKLAEAILLYCKFAEVQKSKISSGFTSIVKTRYRSGDNSLMAELCLSGYDDYVKFLELNKAKQVKDGKKKNKVEQKSKKKKLGEKKVKEPEVSERKFESGSAGKTAGVSKKESFLSRLGGRILGRKVIGPDQNKRKIGSNARSGL